MPYVFYFIYNLSQDTQKGYHYLFLIATLLILVALFIKIPNQDNVEDLTKKMFIYEFLLAMVYVSIIAVVLVIGFQVFGVGMLGLTGGIGMLGIVLIYMPIIGAVVGLPALFLVLAANKMRYVRHRIAQIVADEFSQGQ